MLKDHTQATIYDFYLYFYKNFIRKTLNFYFYTVTFGNTYSRLYLQPLF